MRSRSLGRTPDPTHRPNYTEEHQDVEVHGDMQTVWVVTGTVLAPENLLQDWTTPYNDNDGLWRYHTQRRYDMMLEQLKAFKTVQYCSGGSSLVPLVYPWDVCFLAPIDATLQPEAGDIVFCIVQPKSRYFVHLIWRTYEYTTSENVDKQVYVIGNNRTGIDARENGWCYRQDLSGILTKTQRGVFQRKTTM